MTTPVWVLFAFALWTIAVLMVGVGVRRWSLILTGNAQITDFPADTLHGGTAYRRAVRAHANCVENLPVFAAIVIAISASGLASATVDALAVIFLIARVCQSLIHMTLTETNTTVAIRFTFFLIQIVAMIWLAVEVVRHATL